MIGRRNADGSFSGTFKNYLGSLSNITSYRFDGNFNISSFIHCTNTEYANSIASPKPSFRFVNGDSCLSFWPDYFNINHTVGFSAINFYLKVTNDGYYNDVTDKIVAFPSCCFALCFFNIISTEAGVLAPIIPPHDLFHG